MSTDTLDTEIAEAEERLEKLRHLSKLRQEADVLEFNLNYGANAKQAESIVLSAVCKRYRLGIQLLRCPSRAQGLVWPRFVAMYFLRKFTTLMYGEIARAVGRTNHSTTVHGIQQVEHRLGMANEGEFRNMLYELQREIERGMQATDAASTPHPDPLLERGGEGRLAMAPMQGDRNGS